ncbi:MAG: peptide MFS transporter [Suipraeoptans sp.]
METKQKYPMGFYVCSLSFTFERCAYYAARWLIAVFIVAAVVDGGLGLTAADGALMSSNLVAFTYIAPVFGGIITDRWIGARYCVPVGMVLMGLGYILGAQATDKTLMYVMIALVSIGTGLFKGQISALNGRQFDKKVLDSIFSVQYSFVNIGSFIGTTLVGIFITRTGNYKMAFTLCGIVMFIGTIWFIIGSSYLGDIGKLPFKVENKEEENVKAIDIEAKPLTSNDKKRIAAIILVSAFSIVFWLFWYLAYMPVYYYWPEHMNWVIGGFEVPTAWFDSLNALCCITMGPLLAIVWSKLQNRAQGDMSMFKKTALGLILLGVSFGVFALADVVRGGGVANLMWIVAFGILLSLGEMVFSPLGNSFVSKWAPAKLLSVMMGVWTFATFIAAKSYGYLYAFLETLPFAPSYFVVAAIAAVCGVILWIISGKLDKLTD